MPTDHGRRWRFPNPGEVLPAGCEVVAEVRPGPWRRLNRTAYIDPDGFIVSTANMTLELRNRLGVADHFEEDLGNERAKAWIHTIRQGHAT